ncbi:MAG: ABC transporter permease [Granulosicoccaceae bacterium]
MALSALNRRRWQVFKAHKRGYRSLWIFLVLFVLSLAAELIANDKPLLVKYKDEFYFPAWKVYTETTFGGEFESEAEYRDPFVAELIEADGWIVFPPIPYSYNTIDYESQESPPAAPDARHWLGTDDQNRDVLARAIYGFRISVLFGLALTVASTIIGVAAGAVQGYFGGRVDLLGQRFVEVWQGLPVLYVLIILATVVEPGFWSLLTIMVLVQWTALVGVVRAEFLRVRNFDYIKAARALGVSDAMIMWRHVLPNAMVATLTFLPFVLSASVVTLTSLDYLGFGLPIGSPSLGELLKQGKNNVHAPWLGLSGFFVVSLMLSLMVFVGEAVRDAFDPRKTFAQGDS